MGNRLARLDADYPGRGRDCASVARSGHLASPGRRAMAAVFPCPARGSIRKSRAERESACRAGRSAGPRRQEWRAPLRGGAVPPEGRVPAGFSYGESGRGRSLFPPSHRHRSPAEREIVGAEGGHELESSVPATGQAGGSPSDTGGDLRLVHGGVGHGGPRGGRGATERHGLTSDVLRGRENSPTKRPCCRVRKTPWFLSEDES